MNGGVFSLWGGGLCSKSRPTTLRCLVTLEYPCYHFGYIASNYGLPPMAYLEPHFENDVFVSYSQGDPAGVGDSPLKRWTEDLINKLRADILSVDTEFDQLRLWIDAQIDPTAPLTAELRQKVQSSGILIIVMSPRYLNSRWCKDELDWFREQVRERSSDQGRVFVVRVLPTKRAPGPSSCATREAIPWSASSSTTRSPRSPMAGATSTTPTSSVNYGHCKPR